MKKIILISLRSILYLFIGLLIFLSGLLCFLQTDLAKTPLTDWLEISLQKQGSNIKITPIQGRFPLKWKIEKIVICKDGDFIILQNIKLQLALLPLFEKKIAFKKIDIGRLEYLFKEQSTKSQPLIGFPLVIDSLKIKEVAVENQTKNKKLLFSVIGKGSFDPKKKQIFANLQIDSGNNSLSVFFEKKEQVTCHIEALFFSFTPFEFFLPVHSNGEMRLSSSITGEWDTWKSLLEKTPSQKKLNGKSEIAFNSSLFLKESQNWHFNTCFSLQPYTSIEITTMHMQSPLMDIHLHGELQSDGTPCRLSSSFILKNLSLLNSSFPASGSAKGVLEFDKKNLDIQIFSEKITIYEKEYFLPKIKLRGEKIDSEWEGSISALADFESSPLLCEAKFSFLEDHLLQLKTIECHAEDAHIEGALEIYPFKPSINGHISLEIPEAAKFCDNVYGRLTLQIFLQNQTHEADLQKAEVKAALLGFRLPNFWIQKTDLEVHVEKLFTSPLINFQTKIQEFYFRDLLLTSCDVKGDYQEGTWSFKAASNGNWKEPLEVNTAFFLKNHDEQIHLTITEFTSSVLQNHFILKKPLLIHKDLSHISIENLDGEFDKGFLKGNLSFSENDSFIEIQSNHIPLDFLSLLSPHVNLKGFGSLDVQFSSSKDTLPKGRLLFLLERGILTQEIKTEDLKAKGSLQIHLENNIAQLHSYFIASENQFIDLSSTFYIDYVNFPPRIFPVFDKPVTAHLAAEGKIEEIFDFIDLGTNYIAGWISGHLLISGSIREPKLLGEIQWDMGTYENYYTGTYLKNITTKFTAQNQEVEMVLFSSSDEKEGKLNAQGSLLLDPNKRFPYHIELELQHLHALALDFVESSFSGNITIEGSLDTALAKGKLIPEARFLIPDTIPDEIPEIPVKYINMPAFFEIKNMGSKKDFFPFALDLIIEAPKKILVEGKGLQSEWGGEILLSGTTSNVITTGTLNLQRGYYTFSGKKFSLSEGEIVFAHKNNQTAYLNLQGNLTLPDVTVIAVLRGPLLSPQLTFQSIPQMPTSAILSRVLFNKDLSEISPVQAVQLAQMIITLTGKDGSDVLETIRKSLGVDRFTIVSSPNSADEISVQIGKYIVQGVMVTLSQGMDSSQIIVEVELKNGFVLQAETQENEEGKFSLKWNYNY